eukprot:7064274-Prymnesium_polylepis.1
MDSFNAGWRAALRSTPAAAAQPAAAAERRAGGAGRAASCAAREALQNPSAPQSRPTTPQPVVRPGALVEMRWRCRPCRGSHAKNDRPSRSCRACRHPCGAPSSESQRRMTFRHPEVLHCATVRPGRPKKRKAKPPFDEPRCASRPSDSASRVGAAINSRKYRDEPGWAAGVGALDTALRPTLRSATAVVGDDLIVVGTASAGACLAATGACGSAPPAAVAASVAAPAATTDTRLWPPAASGSRTTTRCGRGGPHGPGRQGAHRPAGAAHAGRGRVLHRADVRATRLRPDGGRASPARLVAHAPAGVPERRSHHRHEAWLLARLRAGLGTRSAGCAVRGECLDDSLWSPPADGGGPPTWEMAGYPFERELAGASVTRWVDL